MTCILTYIAIAAPLAFLQVKSTRNQKQRALAITSGPSSSALWMPSKHKRTQYDSRILPFTMGWTP